VDARLILASLALTAGPALAQGFDHAHGAWDALLKKHVVLLDGGKASQLDYAGMAQERAALKGYLDGLSGVGEAQVGAWSRPQQMAFLIDACNAFTVEKILTRYPDIRSIWDFGKLFGNPFKDEFFTLRGRKRSLDAIEHGMLRPAYRLEAGDFEPRARYFAPYADALADDAAARAAIGAGRAALEFLGYDWTLNDSRSSSRR
jgi:hypothetical protein